MNSSEDDLDYSDMLDSYEDVSKKNSLWPNFQNLVKNSIEAFKKDRTKHFDEILEKELINVLYFWVRSDELFDKYESVANTLLNKGFEQKYSYFLA